ncbi:N-acylneuraminate cytidylyltransferase [Candidatus Planktophila dulcis]|nr:N-acylneuraminate cytidylyltransferase [Candidatus Planktophila dulcis]
MAIIPARGGSKRIPKKNIKKFCGQPILELTIHRLLGFEIFDQIFVSSDDDEVKTIARQAGADVINRPVDLADDFATTVEVMSSAVRDLSLNQNLDNTLVCCVYPVSPFITKNRLEAGLTLLDKEKVDYVFTAKANIGSIYRSFSRGPNNEPLLLYPENSESRTQDLPENFFDAALFYLGAPNAWIAEKPILTGNSRFIEIGKYETIDVDEIEDWNFAQEIYKLRMKS